MHQIILKYFPDLSPIQIDQFSRLGDLYKDWNEKINVISRKDIDSLYEKHVLHSLAIGKFVQFTDGTTILDVGTGGGFPGIPLAILFPNCQFTLIDSIGKKITVVNAIADSLGLSNVVAKQARVEQIKEQFDFVVSRAVTAFPAFLSMVKSRIIKRQNNSISNGIIYLKGGDFSEELEPFVKRVFVTDITSFFKEDFFETKKIIHWYGI